MTARDAAVDRDARMRERVLRTARARVGDAERLRPLSRALESAGRLRIGAIADPHDPDLLRPGRTVLILLNDVGWGDVPSLALGALAESRRPELRVVHDPLGGPGLPALRAIEELDPAPAKDLLAALSRTPPEVATVWCAERLDQLRHAHLLADRAMARRMALRAPEVELPLAHRLHPTLGRRLAWWCTRVAPTLQA